MNKVAFAFGRLNPPTRGHLLLVTKISEQDAEPRLYLSHSCDQEKNPLSYEKKLYWCEQSFGDIVNVTESASNNMYLVMHDLYEEGVTDVIYLCGSDRAAEAERLKTYNGKPDKQGNIVFLFDSIEVVKVGEDRINEDDIPVEKVSASLMRKFARENDLDSFIQCCPEALDEDQCAELFNDVREGMGFTEELEEDLIGEASRQVIGEVTITYIQDGKLSHSTYPLKDNNELIMGEDRRFSLWLSRRIISILANEKIYTDVEISSRVVTGTRRVIFICGNKKFYGAKGKESRGAQSESSFYLDSKKIDTAFLYIKNDLMLKDPYIEDIKLLEVINTGGENNKRPIDYLKMFTTPHLFGKDNKAEGRNIADNVYRIEITKANGDVEQSEQYLSNKFGPIHTPINAGINNYTIKEILNPIVNTSSLTVQEKDVLVDWWKTKSTIKNLQAINKNTGEKYREWSYSFYGADLYQENIKNYLINLYSSGYYYVVEDYRGNILIENIDDVNDIMWQSDITDALMTISHSQLCINATIMNKNYLIDFRRKGGTNYNLLSKITPSNSVKRKGIVIDNISEYDFEYVDKPIKESILY